jgi:hypothetical protein
MINEYKKLRRAAVALLAARVYAFAVYRGRVRRHGIAARRSRTYSPIFPTLSVKIFSLHWISVHCHSRRTHGLGILTTALACRSGRRFVG